MRPEEKESQVLVKKIRPLREIKSADNARPSEPYSRSRAATGTAPARTIEREAESKAEFQWEYPFFINYTAEWIVPVTRDFNPPDIKTVRGDVIMTRDHKRLSVADIESFKNAIQEMYGYENITIHWERLQKQPKVM